ncbi:hypothetical protein FHU40_000797 [Nocardioides soli]|uniref:Uncharacterized protein n=1 Tax=Nocardioides soli TaxID=1036020 RepID=A0A7W4Z0P9_9ACTN|nr:hypothetical protein [Nocardioides soli]
MTQLDTSSSASRQHYIDTGEYLPLRTHLSGWCTAPTGARPHHEHCHVADCQCACHDEEG